MASETTYALIMAGGAGTRFWPASRKARPKQLLALAGEHPLIRQTANRLLPLCDWPHIYVSTGQHLVGATREVLPELDEGQLLVEPVGRNTAPCIGWAAATIARHDPDGVIIALPSDPHIADEDAYREVLRKAIESARAGTITTVGITPTHPETGYGYIEAGPPAELAGVRHVERFVEKPDRRRAEQFVASGNYFWNAGMFIFRARDMLAAIATHLPDLARGLEQLDEAAARGSEQRRLEEVFPTLPAISIDNGVMEYLSDLAVVPGQFGWSDVGSWLSVSQLAVKSERGNSGPPETVFVAAKNNHVVDLRTAGADKRIISLVGVEGLVVVETDDALLVVDAQQSQQVRQVVDQLRARGDDRLT